MLNDKNILIGITGGIAAYKVCELIRMYKRAGANVRVVCTENALNFVTKLTLQNLSQNEVGIDEFKVDFALCGCGSISDDVHLQLLYLIAEQRGVLLRYLGVAINNRFAYLCYVAVLQSFEQDFIADAVDVAGRNGYCGFHSVKWIFW